MAEREYNLFASFCRFATSVSESGDIPEYIHTTPSAWRVMAPVQMGSGCQKVQLFQLLFPAKTRSSANAIC
jgi:hypothetical protein